jgi:hypothetical protein
MTAKNIKVFNDLPKSVKDMVGLVLKYRQPTSEEGFDNDDLVDAHDLVDYY